jgi:hypothetical protein
MHRVVVLNELTQPATDAGCRQVAAPGIKITGGPHDENALREYHD